MNSNGAVPDGKDAMSIFSSAPKSGEGACCRCAHHGVLNDSWPHLLLSIFSWFCLKSLLVPLTALDESPQDDAAAKATAPLTRETDLVVLYSDLENIFDEEEDELGVSERFCCRAGIRECHDYETENL